MTAESPPPATPADHRIVVATDLSEGAKTAVWRGARLAQALGAELTLLHVFDDSLWATLVHFYDAERWGDEEAVLAARKELSRQAGQIASELGIRVEAETLTGPAAATIAAFVVERRARLLVVGEHGESWIGDTVVGGTALKALKLSGAPVLLARRPASADYRRILVASDFSDCAARAARLARELFPTAQRTLLYAYAVAFEGRMRLAGAHDADIERYREAERRRAEEKLREFAAAIGEAADWQLKLEFGSPASVICEQALQHDADLVVIGRHGGSEVEERILGSVTQNVLYHAGCDVLLSP